MNEFLCVTKYIFHTTPVTFAVWTKILETAFKIWSNPREIEPVTKT